ncbi:MAG: thioredoxin family protein [Byssovorax sp.]
MLREVASSKLQLGISVALLAAGIGCGALPACSGPATSIPVVTLPNAPIAPIAPIASAAPAAPTADSAPMLASVASVPSRASKPPTAIVWMTSERDARDRARLQNLPLLVYVRADWAAACRALERGAWLDARVLAEARRFVPLRLDVTDAEADAELYAQRYGVRTIPEIIVVDPAGRTHARSAGAPSADDLVSLLHGAASQ